MQKRSNDLPNVTFRPLTTAESISVVACDFKNLAKPRIFNPARLHAGRVLRTREGVWINPLDAQDKPVQNEEVLKGSLKDCKKIEVRDSISELNF